MVAVFEGTMPAQTRPYGYGNLLKDHNGHGGAGLERISRAFQRSAMRK